MKNKILKFLVIALIAGQLGFSFSFLLVPKRAEAFLGIGDVTFTWSTEVANWYDVVKDIGLGIAERLAISYANKYLKQFVDKLINKYRIKDYLAYQKVLSGYYLNQYVYQHVQDPNLRQIYSLLASEANASLQVTDQRTGQRTVLLTRLKTEIDKYYYGQGGISGNYLSNPPLGTRAYDYYSAAYTYYLSPPDFTDQYLAGEYGSLQSRAAAAAQSEIAQSQGFKNDRSAPAGFVPHFCEGAGTILNDFEEEELPEDISIGTPTQQEEPPPGIGFLPNILMKIGFVSKAQAAIFDSQADCEAQGGTWKVDATGMFSSVIQNPSAFVHDFSTNAIQTVFTNNFKMGNNIYSAIGSLLGNFIFAKLNLDRNNAGGTLNEKGDGYSPPGGSVSIPPSEIDLDEDRIWDGLDGDEDDKLESVGIDTCYHGGIVPDCQKSSEVPDSPYFTPICVAIDQAEKALTKYAEFLDRNAEDIKGGATLKGMITTTILASSGYLILFPFLVGDDANFKEKADAELWGKESSIANSAVQQLIDAIDSYHNPDYEPMQKTLNRYTNFMGKVSSSLFKDSDLDLTGWVGSGGGGLRNLMKHTGNMLKYIRQIKEQIGRCDKPNLSSIGGIEPPEISDPNDEEGNGCYEDFQGSFEYGSAVLSAMEEAVAENPEIASHANAKSANPDFEADAAALMGAAVEKLRASGFKAAIVIKCSGVPSDDKILVGQPSDTYGEMFDVFKGNEDQGDDRSFAEQIQTSPVQHAAWEAGGL